MAAITNERDIIIGGASARVLSTDYNYISLESSHQYFRAAIDGTFSPLNIVITAKLFGILEGTVTFTSDDTLFTVDGNTCTVNYLNPEGDTFSIKASLTHLGITHEATIALSIIHDGAVGASGDSLDIIYQKAVTQPNTPAPSTTTPVGWVSTVAELGLDTTKITWASVGRKLSGANAYTWDAPYALEGSSFAEVTIFKRSLTNITTAPTGGSYNFNTKVLTVPEGWSATIPTGTAKVYSSKATAKIYGATGVDSALTWSTPAASLQDAVVVALDSAVSIVNCDEYGQQYILPTNKLNLYSGGTLQVSPNVVFSGTKTQNGLTLGIDTSTGAITLTGQSWTTDKETFTLTATYGGVNYTLAYTVSKSRAGTSAIYVDLLRETSVVFANNDGTGYSLPEANVISLYRGTAKVTSDVTYGIVGTNPVNGLLAAVDASGNITVSSTGTNSWNTNSTTISVKATYNSIDYIADYTLVKARKGDQGVPGSPGSPAITVSLKSEQEVITAANNGTGYTLPTGNAFLLYEGNVLKTTGVSYSGTATKNGLTVAIDPATGIITLSGDAWTTDSETFDLTATYSGITYTKTYKVVKVKQGSVGADGQPTIYVDLLSEADVCSAAQDGTGYTLPTGNMLRMYRGGSQILDTTDLEFKVSDGISSLITSDTANIFKDVATNQPLTYMIPWLSAGASNTGLSIVYGTATTSYIYSTNNGVTWSSTMIGPAILTHLTSTPNAIFGCAGNTIYRTVDGINWTVFYTLPATGSGNKIFKVESNGVNYLGVLASDANLTTGVGGTAIYVKVLVLNETSDSIVANLPANYTSTYAKWSIWWTNDSTIAVLRDTTLVKLPITKSGTTYSYGSSTTTAPNLDGSYVAGQWLKTASNLNGTMFVTGSMGVGTYSTELYKSTDSGSTWVKVTGISGISGAAYWVSYSKYDDVFYITTNTGMVYRTGNASTGYTISTASAYFVIDIKPLSALVSGLAVIPLTLSNTSPNLALAYSATSSSFPVMSIIAGETVTKDGVLIGISPTGSITMSAPGNSWISDYIQITFQVKYLPTSQLFTVRYSLAKAKAGLSGASVRALIMSAGESLVCQSAYSGSGYTLPSASTALLYDGPSVVAGTLYGISVGTVSTTDANLIYKTQNGLTLTINKNTGALSWSGTSWSTNYETFTVTATAGATTYSSVISLTKLRSGDAAVTAYLLSEADVVSADTLGGAYTLPTGNSLKIYLGGVEVTSGVTFAGTATKNGLTLTINSVGAITLSGVAWTTNQESFTLTATYNSVTYTKIYTITKTRAGSNAVFLDLDREVAQVVANSDGTGYTLPGAGAASVYSGAAKVTSGVTYGVSGGTITAGVSSKTQNGLTCNVNTSTGAISVTGTSWTSTYEEFTISAIYNSITYNAIYRVLKALKGTDGASAITLLLNSNSEVVSADAYGGSYTYPASNVAGLYIGGSRLSSSVTYTIVGGVTTSGVSSKTQNGLTFSLNTSTGVLSYSGASWNTNQESITINAAYNSINYTSTYIITKALAGTSVVNIDLLAEVSYVPALNDGTGYTLPPANQITLYSGANQLTTGVTYGVVGGTLTGSTVAVTKNGLTCSVHNTLGSVTFTAPSNSWTTDTENFNLTATFNNITYTATFTAVKGKIGSSGTKGDSIKVAYTKTTLTSLASTPTTIVTAGFNTLPSNDSWGTGTIWQLTPPAISAGQSVWQTNGIYNASTGETTWAVPYLSALKVGKLSALSADLGTITAGNITGASIGIGNTPAVSGTSMTGDGMIINTNGTFAIGNAITNMSFNGSRLTLNGDIVTAANIQQGAVMYINSTYRGDYFAFSTSYASTVQTVLSLQVYCSGGPILILCGIKSRDIVDPTYTRTSTGTTSWGRSRTFSLMRGYNNSTTQVGDSLSMSQTDSNYVIQAYDPQPGTGYNTYNLQVNLAALPSDTTSLYAGSMLFRSIMVIQVK